MASFGRKLMDYFGLSDDFEEDYEDEYEEQQRAGRTPITRGVAEPREPATTTIRHLAPPEERSASPLRPRPAPIRAIAPDKPVVHVVKPVRFADAQEIGDYLRASQPVIVNLQMADKDLSRRMIDFCSGVAYALGGHMDKVGEQVFLLSPAGVTVSTDERDRSAEPEDGRL
jgi:cell division inhibitor SepF